jgi:hypothetical protein
MAAAGHAPAHRWLEAGVLALGLGAALTAGTGVAHADVTGSAGSASTPNTSNSPDRSSVSSAGVAGSSPRAGAAPGRPTHPGSSGSGKPGSVPSAVVGNGRQTGSQGTLSSGLTGSAADVATDGEQGGPKSFVAATDDQDVQDVAEAARPAATVADAPSTSAPASAGAAGLTGPPDTVTSLIRAPMGAGTAMAGVEPNLSPDTTAASPLAAPADDSLKSLFNVADPLTAPVVDVLRSLEPLTSQPVVQSVLVIIRDLAVSFTNLLSSVPANPATDIVIGGFLWLRRNFFDEGPTVHPVQTSGQTVGPIGGSIGAVDPEQEALTYQVIHQPLYGTLALGPDGEYTYTPGPNFKGVDVFAVVVSDGGTNFNLLDPKASHSVGANVDVDQGPDTHQLDFKFSYLDGAALWTPQARTELEYSGKVLSTYFVVIYPVTVDYDVIGETDTAGGSPLAFSQSDRVANGSGFNNTIVQQKIQTGQDTNGAAADGRITFNFGYNWGYGSSVTSDQYDFVSTAMHELVHTFGFVSGVSAPGANTGTSWYTYDRFVSDSTGAKPIDGTDFMWNSAFDPNLTGGNGGLYFNGPNAVAVYGGPVPLFAPSPWDSGSSMHHLDDVTFNGQQLMNAKFFKGPRVRVLSPVEVAMLQDLGYDMGLPEPADAAALAAPADTPTAAATVAEAAADPAAHVADEAPDWWLVAP